MTCPAQPELLFTTVLRRLGIQAKPEFIVEHGNCDAWWYASVDGGDIAMLTVYAEDPQPLSVDCVRLNLHHPILAQVTGIRPVQYGRSMRLHRAGVTHTFPIIHDEVFIGGQRLDLQHLTVAELRHVQQALADSETWTGLVRADGLTILSRKAITCINGMIVPQAQVLHALTDEGVTALPTSSAA